MKQQCVMLGTKCAGLIFTLFFVQSVFAQKISNVDFDDVKTKIQDSATTYYYPVLLERFLSFDTSLTALEMQYIYYGNVFQAVYNPYGESKDEKQFNELFDAQKYLEATPFGVSAFKENPVNVRLLYNLMVCHDKTGYVPTAQKYANLYFPLLDVIYASGNGMGLNRAYVVIRVTDEYDIVGDMGLQITEQALVNDVDVLTVNTKLQRAEKGKKKIKKLYFNVRMPLENLRKEFKK